MEPIKFYTGTETGIIVEKNDFDKSLFRDQYKQSFALIDRIIEQQKVNEANYASNVVAFCGDRGEGKTSCLTTMAQILKNEELQKEAKQKLGIDSQKYDFLVLDTIDPSFFDKRHNLIDLLLGQMYANLMTEKDSLWSDWESQLNMRTKILQDFAKVKKSLKVVNGGVGDAYGDYDELEETDNLAAAVRLKIELDDLFKHYLEFFHKGRLLICIDDLDLNMQCGYRMAEEIRNYLSLSSYCILFVALKVEQMEQVVLSEYCRGFDGMTKEDKAAMAERYVTKLIPLSQRIIMPKGDFIAELELQLILSKDGKEEVQKYPSVKEAVVQLIYQKTRYIFVNSPSLSPIVPTNLRELRHLIGLLSDMVDENAIEDNIGDCENKRVFKQYFYGTWTKCLSSEDAKFVRDILAQNDAISINKSVLNHLNDRLKDIDEYKRLFGNGLQGVQEYNISLGDVFACLRAWEHTISSANDRNLLFFLRAFYSMKMYDLYNYISSEQGALFPQGSNNSDDPQKPSLYKYDILLQQQNQLQMLLNGSYFSYNENDIIAKEDASGYARDRRLIKAQKLLRVLKQINAQAVAKQGIEVTIVKNRKKESELEKKDNTAIVIVNPNNSKDEDVRNIEYAECVRLCEFFALTTIAGGTTELTLEKQRKLNYPYYVKKYEESNFYLLFDVLSVFYNIVNIQQAYQKFNDMIGDGSFDFYKIAKDCNKSLINEMLNGYDKNDGRENINKLISDAIIRVTEVQMSILDNLINNRLSRKNKKGGNISNIKSVYDEIQKVGIRLYPIKDNCDCHPLNFSFLSKLVEFLDKVDVDLFDLIYSRTSIETAEEFVIELLKMIKYPISSSGLRVVLNQKKLKPYYTAIKDVGFEWKNVIGERKTFDKLESVNSAFENVKDAFDAAFNVALSEMNETPMDESVNSK